MELIKQELTRHIGSIFHDEKYNVDIMVVKDTTCKECFYEHKERHCPSYTGYCSAKNRADGMAVKFVEVKK